MAARLGMAAMLPHDSTSFIENNKPILDDTTCSTTKSASPTLPSIEGFRDVRREQPSLGWQGESGAGASLQSMSCSFPDDQVLSASTSKDWLIQRSFSSPQRWSAPGVRQRSFVKIKAPVALPVECPSDLTPASSAAGGGDGDSGGQDESSSGSYTSVYTWTSSATTTAVTSTQGRTGSRRNLQRTATETLRRCTSPCDLPKPFVPNLHSTAIHPFTCPEIGGESCISPIVVLKPLGPNLHSTAIHPSTCPEIGGESCSSSLVLKPSGPNLHSTAIPPSNSPEIGGENSSLVLKPRGPKLHSTAIHPSRCPEVGGENCSLVLRPCGPKLHSTAIQPSHNPRGMLSSPQVSPIRWKPEEDRKQRTPSAPTPSLSPRGPRKSQSFLSKTARTRGPPKCSTMLFSSPLPDAGDAPPDVSSITLALSHHLDLGRPADAESKNLSRVKVERCESRRDKVLTSTPHASASKNLMWNVSAVHGTTSEDELELIPLQQNENTVNSGEIIAASLDADSISPCLHQQFEQDVAARTPGVGDHTSAAGTPLEAESGVTVDSYREAVCTITPGGGGGSLERKARSQTSPLRKETSERTAHWEMSAPRKEPSGRKALCQEAPGRKGHCKRQLQLAQVGCEAEVCPVSVMTRHPKDLENRPGLTVWMESQDSGFLEHGTPISPDIIGLISKRSPAQETYQP